MYQERVKAARRAKPRNELVWGHQSNETLHRQVPIWVKVEPRKPVDGTQRSTLHVFLEDTIGNRVRTVPDSVLLEPEAPLRVVGPARKATRDGAVTFDVEWPVGKPARATVRAMPYVSSREVILPSGSPLELLPHPEPVIKTLPLSPEIKDLMERTLAWARKIQPEGQAMRATRFAFLRAHNPLSLRRYPEALEALELAQREFHDPISTWVRGQLLRRMGRAKEGDAILAELARKHPDSVPAQFTRPQPGEVWFTPYNGPIRDAGEVGKDAGTPKG